MIEGLAIDNNSLFQLTIKLWIPAFARMTKLIVCIVGWDGYSQ